VGKLFGEKKIATFFENCNFMENKCGITKGKKNEAWKKTFEKNRIYVFFVFIYVPSKMSLVKKNKHFDVVAKRCFFLHLIWSRNYMKKMSPSC